MTGPALIWEALPSAPEYCVGLIFGLPYSEVHAFAQRCRKICETSLGHCDIVHCNDLSAPVVDAMRSASRPYLLLSDAPTRDVIEFAAARTFPLIGFDADFAEACAAYALTHGADLWDTIRRFTSARMAQWQFTDVPRAILMQAVSQISRMDIVIALQLDPATFGEVQDEDCASEAMSGSDSQSASFSIALPSQTHEKLWDINAFYGQNTSANATRMRVPREVLLNGTPPHGPAIGKIELTGPARCLIFGPYLHLPAGRWMAKYRFACTRNVSGNTFLIDVVSNLEVRNADVFELREAGEFQHSIAFTHEDPWHALELRIVLSRGSIDGNFELLGLELERFVS